MGTFFIVWNFIWLFAFVLLLFRSDTQDLFSLFFIKIKTGAFWSFVFLVIILYFYIPFTLPYSIENIMKNKNEGK